MGLSINDIVTKFPLKNIPTITGEPDYSSINEMVQQLYGNAASLPTTLGGGAHGHIGLLMTQAIYATISATPYILPNDPGPAPTNGNAAAREAARIQHKELRRVFDNNTSMDDAIKAQIIDSVNDTYLNELRNKYTGYMGVSSRDLIDHLLDRYGKITPADIEECKKRMNEPIDSSQPIDIYFQKIDDCIQYAVDGQVAFTPGQILQTVYHAVSTSGYYNEACKEWRKKPLLDKTWPSFKRFFAAEYHDLKEQNKVNSSQSNFHSANAVMDISTALDNLAMAATNDRDLIAQLTATNQQLVATNQQLTEQLRKSIETTATLVKKMAQTPSTNNNDHNTKKPFDRAEWEAKLNPSGYCWTHGYRVQHGHDSKNCKGKLGGHQDTATRADTQGGSTKGST
jgi:hypothetical protein